jgi:hypothetical protein
MRGENATLVRNVSRSQQQFSGRAAGNHYRERQLFYPSLSFQLPVAGRSRKNSNQKKKA